MARSGGKDVGVAGADKDRNRPTAKRGVARSNAERSV